MRGLLLVLTLLLPVPAYPADVTVLTYHDIVDNPKKDKYAVSVTSFRQQLEYIKANGYRPIRLQDYQRAVNKHLALPDKAVLLTFDDGLVSYRDTVVPLLKQYGYPSMLSIVSSWTDGQGTPEEYRGKLLGWAQLKTLARDPLVEIVSHSHALHRWVISSPQQTYAPSAITRVYQVQQHSYETEQAFQQRIRNDLVRARERFRKELGFEPTALTWPYGEYDQVTMGIARKVGFRYQLTLDEGQASRLELPNVRRFMVLRDHTLADVGAMLGRAYRSVDEQRFVELGLDVFSHVSRGNHPLLIQQLANRIDSLGVNTVVVTPFSVDGRKAYFPNKYLPVEIDLLNGILDKLRAQLGVEQVYLRFPAGLENLPEDLFTQLARSSRFNAILFDKPPSTAVRDRLWRAMKQYLPDIRIGSWRSGNSGLDIAVVDVGNNMPKTATGKTVLVYVAGNDYLTATGLADVLRSLRNNGVRNYGYGSLNYMAGAQAPDEVIEAMAYRLRRGRP